MSLPAIDISGQKFGRLTAVRPTNGRFYRQVVWSCLCDCGENVKVPSGVLRNGNKKSCGCLLRRPKGEAAFNQVLNNYKCNAKDRGIYWHLASTDAKNIFKTNCYYCNRKPSNRGGSRLNNGYFLYNGIDRIDNNKGYFLENCVPCCVVCNKAKQQMTLEQFRLWSKDLYENFGSKDNS